MKPYITPFFSSWQYLKMINNKGADGAAPF